MLTSHFLCQLAQTMQVRSFSVFLCPLRPTDHNSIFCDFCDPSQTGTTLRKLLSQKKPVHEISSKPLLEFNQGTLVCPQGGLLWIPAVHSDLHSLGQRLCLYHPPCHSDPPTGMSQNGIFYLIYLFVKTNCVCRTRCLTSGREKEKGKY